MAWLWLSTVMDNAADRRICLENVLTLNPRNTYARRGLKQLENSTAANHASAAFPAQKNALGPPAATAAGRSQFFSRPLPLWLVTAFWSGLSILLLISGLLGLVDWGLARLRSRVPLNQLHAFHIFELLVIIIFLIAGVMAINVALALFKQQRSGFYGSLIMAMGLLMVGPTAGLLLNPPSFLISAFLGIMPASVVLLTLASQASFERAAAND